MASDAETLRPRAALEGHGARALWLDWSLPAFGAIAFGAAFVAVSCWWLSLSHGIPVYDSGGHLTFAFDIYEELGAGQLTRALTRSAPYPPLTYLVGDVGILLGGVGVAPPIVAENVVFVALLGLGCYKVARMAFGASAGMLAVVFALGAPMIVEEFHEFMLDAPEAAMVAVSLWAVLATERFSRLRACALAGLAVGLGLLSKETFVYFLVGPVLVTAVRGGPRAWRGMAVFAAVALLIALPWYAHEYSTIHTLASEALGSSGSVSSQIPGLAPPRFSSANLEWYMWSLLNWQLLVPLCAFALVGLLWTIAGFVRRRPVSPFALELTAGAFVSWLALTETYIHDPRYSMPMMVYFAVLGVGWITRLPRVAGGALAALLVAVSVANTVGVGFGVGRRIMFGPGSPALIQQPRTATLYANYGFWIGPPSPRGDMLGVLRRLRRAGVSHVIWSSESESDFEFSIPGITALAKIAGLAVPSTPPDPARVGPRYAFLHHGAVEAGLPPPCTTLQDGTGVWVRLGGSRAWSYCPRGPA